MICERCDEPIRAGERYSEYPVDSPNGAVPNVVLHDSPCRPAPALASPVTGTAA
jgi:hypothetical protein